LVLVLPYAEVSLGMAERVGYMHSQMCWSLCCIK